MKKDLITQPDGGYLTSLGRDAVEHVQTILSILTTQASGGREVGRICLTPLIAFEIAVNEDSQAYRLLPAKKI